MDKKSGGGFAEHDGEFCDCGGNGSCEKWAWAGEMADQKACEAKANKLGASCFDYNGPRMDESDVDLAPPAGNITGPVGEVWVTHTELDRHKFGVAMAAMLRNDYTLSLGEQPLPLPTPGRPSAAVTAPAPESVSARNFGNFKIFQPSGLRREISTRISHSIDLNQDFPAK